MMKSLNDDDNVLIIITEEGQKVGTAKSLMKSVLLFTLIVLMGLSQAAKIPGYMDCSFENARQCVSEIPTKCCQQFCTTEIQFILMKHTDDSCTYRYNNDTGQHPEQFLMKKGNKNGPKDTRCCDEDLKGNCEAPHFITWFDVISRCFHQETEGNELVDSSFCQPQPSDGYLKNFNQAVDKLENVVDNDPNLKILAENMWLETPDVFQTFCPGNFSNMIRYLRVVMTKAPQFMAKTTPSGLPQIQMLLCYIYSEAGKRFFATKEVNAAIVEIETAWGEFLSSKESLSVLNDGQFGWKSKCASQKLQMDSYKYNPKDKYWGFDSFNAFFVRSLAKGSRPNKCLLDPKSNCMISFGDNQKQKLRRNLKLTTSVMAKNENYSLLSLFAHNDTLANYFVGGSLMQSMFMPFNYHRFHAPVSGKIVFAKVIPGLIYAVYNQSHSNPVGHREQLEYWIQQGLYGLFNSNPYISQVATRAVLVIETENYGHVGVIAIGLQSVSSIIIDDKMKPGYQITQAEELGMFQYGGSSGIILVEDKTFKWVKGTGKQDAFYMMGQKLGEFEVFEEEDNKNEISDTDNTVYVGGEALGFPVL